MNSLCKIRVNIRPEYPKRFAVWREKWLVDWPPWNGKRKYSNDEKLISRVYFPWSGTFLNVHTIQDFIFAWSSCQSPPYCVKNADIRTYYYNVCVAKEFVVCFSRERIHCMNFIQNFNLIFISFFLDKSDMRFADYIKQGRISFNGK